MIKLLLVEDDEALVYMIKSGLEDIVGGYEVETAINGMDGLKIWEEYNPDVIVSDVDMPVMNGIQMVKQIRETDGDTLILFTSALTAPKNVKVGFEAGVNNYIKKPFVAEELDAHIKSMIKLKNGSKIRNESTFYKIGEDAFDVEHSVLRNEKTNKIITLTTRENKILQILIENKNNVVRREAILSRCWGIEGKDYFASRSLDVFITKLRKLLFTNSNVELKNIRGVGFILRVQ
jgi:DNA-binding response OmpR family regulator